MPLNNLRILAEIVGKQHGLQILLLCVVALAVVAVVLAIVKKMLRVRRTAARRQRDWDAQASARLANRLSELGDREPPCSGPDGGGGGQ
jgi:hypothetical protein